MGKEVRPHIGIFGRMNSGKSSLINCLASQEIAIVASQSGTTTDPVKKSVEILGFGPVIFIDTAGIDDSGELGTLRVKKSMQVIKNIDLAILIIANNQYGDPEELLISHFLHHAMPYFIIHNKDDIEPLTHETLRKIGNSTEVLEFSALGPYDISPVTDLIKKLMPETAYTQTSILGDLLHYGDTVLLITPIDTEAPEGRLILPQVMAIRDILDNDCTAVILKEREVDSFLKKTGITPALAVTDSQVFLKADASVPRNIPLTSFSIILARLKGDFDKYLQGTPKISELEDGDRVLILESCTHQVSCDDIGRVKIPRWISAFTGKKLEFDVVAGLDEIKRPVTDYALVIQCGGCMVTRRQLNNRLKAAIDAGIPVSNYGMAIAYVQGIYSRAIEPFVKVEEDYL